MQEQHTLLAQYLTEHCYTKPVTSAAYQYASAHKANSRFVVRRMPKPWRYRAPQTENAAPTRKKIVLCCGNLSAFYTTHMHMPGLLTDLEGEYEFHFYTVSARGKSRLPEDATRLPANAFKSERKVRDFLEEDKQTDNPEDFHHLNHYEMSRLLHAYTESSEQPTGKPFVYQLNVEMLRPFSNWQDSLHISNLRADGLIAFVEELVLRRETLNHPEFPDFLKQLPRLKKIIIRSIPDPQQFDPLFAQRNIDIHLDLTDYDGPDKERRSAVFFAQLSDAGRRKIKIIDLTDSPQGDGLLKTLEYTAPNLEALTINSDELLPNNNNSIKNPDFSGYLSLKSLKISTPDIESIVLPPHAEQVELHCANLRSLTIKTPLLKPLKLLDLSRCRELEEINSTQALITLADTYILSDRTSLDILNTFIKSLPFAAAFENYLKPLRIQIIEKGLSTTYLCNPRQFDHHKYEALIATLARLAQAHHAAAEANPPPDNFFSPTKPASALAASASKNQQVTALNVRAPNNFFPALAPTRGLSVAASSTLPPPHSAIRRAKRYQQTNGTEKLRTFTNITEIASDEEPVWPGKYRGAPLSEFRLENGQLFTVGQKPNPNAPRAIFDARTPTHRATTLLNCVNTTDPIPLKMCTRYDTLTGPDTMTAFGEVIYDKAIASYCFIPKKIGPIELNYSFLHHDPLKLNCPEEIDPTPKPLLPALAQGLHELIAGKQNAPEICRPFLAELKAFKQLKAPSEHAIAEFDKQVREYFLTFTDETAEPVNFDFSDAVPQAIREELWMLMQKRGACEERTDLAMACYHYVGLPALAIKNDCHKLLELYRGPEGNKKWKLVDLGGVEAELEDGLANRAPEKKESEIDTVAPTDIPAEIPNVATAPSLPTSPPPTVITDKTEAAQEEEKTGAEATASTEIPTEIPRPTEAPDAATSTPATASAIEEKKDEITETKQTAQRDEKIDYDAFFKPFTDKVLAICPDAQSLLPWCLQQKRLLIETSSFAQSRALYQALYPLATEKKSRTVYIESAEDLLNFIETVTVWKNGTLKISNALMRKTDHLIINWGGFSDTEITIYKSLFDSPPTVDKTRFPKRIQITNLMHRADVCDSFTTRFKVDQRILWPNHYSLVPDEKQAVDKKQIAGEIQIANAYISCWESPLLGHIDVAQGRYIFKEGALATAIRNSIRTGKAGFMLLNPPADSQKFDACWLRLETEQRVWTNRGWLPFPPGFSLQKGPAPKHDLDKIKIIREEAAKKAEEKKGEADEKEIEIDDPALEKRLDLLDLFFHYVAKIPHGEHGTPKKFRRSDSRYQKALEALENWEKNPTRNNPVKDVVLHDYEKNSENYAFINVLSKLLFQPLATPDHKEPIRWNKLTKLEKEFANLPLKAWQWRRANCCTGSELRAFFQLAPDADISQILRQLPPREGKQQLPQLSDDALRKLEEKLSLKPASLPEKNKKSFEKSMRRMRENLADYDYGAVVLKGSLDSSKMHAVWKYVHSNNPPRKCYRGRAAIEAWRKHDMSTGIIPVLLIDEADRQPLGSLNAINPIPDGFEVICTVDSNAQCKTRQRDPFLQDQVTVYFKEWSDEERTDALLMPLADRLAWPDDIDKADLCQILLDALQIAKRKEYGAADRFSTSDLEQILLRLEHRLQNNPGSPWKPLLMSAVWDEWSGLIKDKDGFKKALQAQFQCEQEILLPITAQTKDVIAQLEQKAHYIPSSKAYEVQLLLEDIFLQERKQALAPKLAEIDRRPANVGKPGLLIEGSSGIGKSTLLQHIFSILGMPFVQLTAGNFAATEAALVEAFHAGKRVILDESNCLPELEDLVKTFTSGETTEGIPAENPGFYIAASQNNSKSHKGRDELTTTFYQYFHFTAPSDPSRDDLIEMAEQSGLSNEAATELTDAYLRNHGASPREINSRSFFQTLAKLKELRGERVEEAPEMEEIAEEEEADDLLPEEAEIAAEAMQAADPAAEAIPVALEIPILPTVPEPCSRSNALRGNKQEKYAFPRRAWERAESDSPNWKVPAGYLCLGILAATLAFAVGSMLVAVVYALLSHTFPAWHSVGSFFSALVQATVHCLHYIAMANATVAKMMMGTSSLIAGILLSFYAIHRTSQAYHAVILQQASLPPLLPSSPPTLPDPAPVLPDPKNDVHSAAHGNEQKAMGIAEEKIAFPNLYASDALFNQVTCEGDQINTAVPGQLSAIPNRGHLIVHNPPPGMMERIQDNLSSVQTVYETTPVELQPERLATVVEDVKNTGGKRGAVLIESDDPNFVSACLQTTLQIPEDCVFSMSTPDQWDTCFEAISTTSEEPLAFQYVQHPILQALLADNPAKTVLINGHLPQEIAEALMPMFDPIDPHLMLNGKRVSPPGCLVIATHPLKYTEQKAHPFSFAPERLHAIDTNDLHYQSKKVVVERKRGFFGAVPARGRQGLRGCKIPMPVSGIRVQ